MIQGGNYMNKLYVALVIGLAVFAWHRHLEVQTAANLKSYQRGLSSNSDLCTGKKFCAIVYVAPWCGACKSERPRIISFMEKSKNNPAFGIRVVVGQGRSQAENEEMAASFGFGATTDPDNSVLQKLQVPHFPSFFVLDKDNTVILRDQAAFQWIYQKFS